MMDERDELELQRLETLRETGMLNDGDTPELRAICEEAKLRFDVPMVAVTLIAKDRQILKSELGLGMKSTAREDAFCNITIRSDDLFIVPDALLHPRFATNPLVIGPPFIRFYAGAPLIYLADIRLGALCVLDIRPRVFSLGDRAELTEMADRVIDEIARSEFGAMGSGMTD
ncbi:MAG: GAF domain-containing protein [Candidatus Saccharibacteria bacterium]|nr:GAF domain-containing protein [Pseudorhodobacter sp.]